MWKGKGTITWGAILLALMGCNTAQTVKRLPNHPEEYTVPPSDDPRFSQPIKLPEKVLYKDDPLKEQESPLAGPGGKGGAGSGPSFGAGS